MAQRFNLGAKAASTAPPAASPSDAGIQVRMGQPVVINGYRVTAEQLEMLEAQKRDHLYECGALAAGAAVGSFVGFCEAVGRALGAQIMSPANIGNLILFSAATAATLACIAMAVTRGKKGSGIIAQIRKQHD